MKLFAQKLPLSENTSFAVQTISTPAFQTGWHQHIEYELILFTQGSGVAYIGECEGKYEAGDIYILGSNLFHAFKNTKPVSAVVIQFRDNCWGAHFMNMPECRAIKELLELSANGIQVTGNCKHKLGTQIQAMESATDINRIITLLQCLEIMSTAREYIILNKKKAQRLIYRDNDSIDKVVEFTLAKFHDHISLSQVAAVSCMSIPSFCHYFKQRTYKTYIDYLSQVRINHACQQLLETQKPVTEICYESGYNTIVHFHRQFLKFKKTTPLQYRKKYSIPVKALDDLTAVA